MVSRESAVGEIKHTDRGMCVLKYFIVYVYAITFLLTLFTLDYQKNKIMAMIKVHEVHSPVYLFIFICVRLLFVWECLC